VGSHTGWFSRSKARLGSGCSQYELGHQAICYPKSSFHNIEQAYWSRLGPGARKLLVQFDLSDIIFLVVVLSIAVLLINSSGGGGGHRAHLPVHG
jgi:hypothetical protein